jgi:hypothetical protein
LVLIIQLRDELPSSVDCFEVTRRRSLYRHPNDS